MAECIECNQNNCKHGKQAAEVPLFLKQCLPLFTTLASSGRPHTPNTRRQSAPTTPFPLGRNASLRMLDKLPVARKIFPRQAFTTFYSHSFQHCFAAREGPTGPGLRKTTLPKLKPMPPSFEIPLLRGATKWLTALNVHLKPLWKSTCGRSAIRGQLWTVFRKGLRSMKKTSIVP